MTKEQAFFDHLKRMKYYYNLPADQKSEAVYERIVRQPTIRQNRRLESSLRLVAEEIDNGNS